MLLIEPNITVTVDKDEINYNSFSSIKTAITDKLQWDPIVYKNNLTIKISSMSYSESNSFFQNEVGRNYIREMVKRFPSLLYYINSKQLDFLLSAFMDSKNNSAILSTMHPITKSFLTDSLEEFIEIHTLDKSSIIEIYMRIISIPNSATH